MRLKRGNQDGFSGGKGGFHVIRKESDWSALWNPDDLPRFPSFDPKTQMAVFAVAESREVKRLRVTRAVESGSHLNVWVREATTGEGCGASEEERAFDLVTMDRVNKPVTFFVEQEKAESCGEPPAANVQCRRTQDQEWSKTVSVLPGEKVECAMSVEAKGKLAVVDKSLTMSALPPGSAAKLAFTDGVEHGVLETDVYGTYVVAAEVTDDGGRRGSSTATIEVKPPKTKDVLVQLVWTGFDRSDSPDTFPRVNLQLTVNALQGLRCSAQTPVPRICDAQTRGAYTYMRIREGKRRLPLSVQYLDERAEKGPAPCINVWFNGERTAETCERKHRNADESWDVGILDTATGGLAVQDAQPAPGSDAGAN